MYKALSHSQLKKFIARIKLTSLLVQLTFLAFPLTIYMIYNKAIAYNNIDTIWFIFSFLSTIIILQFFLKLLESLHRNLLKQDLEIKYKTKLINSHFDKIKYRTPNLAEKILTDLRKSSEKIVLDIQTKLNVTYLACIFIYFCLVFKINYIIVSIPLVIFVFNYIASVKLNRRYKKNQAEYHILNQKETIFIKGLFERLDFIKSTSLDDKVVKKSLSHIKKSNYSKAKLNYHKNITQKINMVLNIANVAFILLAGRYIFSSGIVTNEEIITCSLLTIWIARPMHHVLSNAGLNIRSKKRKHKKNASNMSKVKQHDKIEIKENTHDDMLEQNMIEDIQNNIDNYEPGFFSCPYRLILPWVKEKHKNVFVTETDKILFYGSLIDNITLFNSSKEYEAKRLVKMLDAEKHVYNLPYLYNYVVTGNNDSAINYELYSIISIIRELLSNPSVLIIRQDANRINPQLLANIFNYTKRNNIKILIYKSSNKVKDLLNSNNEQLSLNDKLNV